MATLCLANMRCIFSVKEWTYDTTTIPLDISSSVIETDNLRTVFSGMFKELVFVFFVLA